MTCCVILLSPTDNFQYFMLAVWPQIFLGRGIYHSLIPSTISIYIHSKPVLVTPCKPPDPVMDHDDSQNLDLKTWVDIYMICGCDSGGVWNIFLDIPLEYVVFSFYGFYYFQVGLCAVVGRSLEKSSTHRVTLYPFKWSCRGFGLLWW